MIAIIKELYVFALLLLLFSYLVPREDYKSYIQFFVGIFLIVILLKPVLSLVTGNNTSIFTTIFDDFNASLGQIEEYGEWGNETRGDIYEIFIFEGKGE